VGGLDRQLDVAGVLAADERRVEPGPVGREDVTTAVADVERRVRPEVPERPLEVVGGRLLALKALDGHLPPGVGVERPRPTEVLEEERHGAVMVVADHAAGPAMVEDGRHVVVVVPPTVP